jgi:hypothetical protein
MEAIALLNRQIAIAEAENTVLSEQLTYFTSHRQQSAEHPVWQDANREELSPNPDAT